MKLRIVCISLLTLLSACTQSSSPSNGLQSNSPTVSNDGGAIGSGVNDNDSNDNDAIGNDPPANTATQPDPNLVSRADTSATLMAVANGLDPEIELISDNFYCFEKTQTNTSGLVNVMTVSDNTLSFFGEMANISPGTDDGELIFSGSDFEGISVTLELTRHGQQLTFNSDSPLEGCYQEGAAHEAALHRFMLNTPAVGVFSCQVAGEMSMNDIEIIDANQYRAAGVVGRYDARGITTDDSSDIVFVSGPLQEAEAQYYEDPDSGMQSLVFTESTSQIFLTGSATASSELAAICSRLSPAKPFKRYGLAKAPQATPPQTPLNGLYFIDTSELTAVTRDDSASFIEFKASGYVYGGLPLPGGTNCERTQPNGLPLCLQYNFDGRTLSTTGPGGTLQAQFSVNADSTLRTLDDYSVELLKQLDATMIIGTWTSQNVESSSFSGCLVGVCSYSITDRTFHFRADGQYLFIFDEESSSSFDAGNLIAFSNGNSRDQGTGTYRINGNRIELTANTGETVELPVHLANSGRLVVGELQYNRE